MGGIDLLISATMGWWLLLAFAIGTAPARLRPIELEVRVFDGDKEVTTATRITVHRAGERSTPFATMEARDERMAVELPQGIYDVQVVLEADGRVVKIRWAERLVVMPYPDEDGHHLEVVNLQSGFGALQVRRKGIGTPPHVALFTAGEREKEAAARLTGPDYALFVVRIGRYDLRIRASDRQTWYMGIDVPSDRTRLWVIP
jgi:hypothetical protein